MSGPISVLLIIGAAVVGPVEAQDTTITNPMPPGMFAPACGEDGTYILPGGLRGARCHVPVYETLDQLCTRAMREIGATRQYSIMAPGKPGEMLRSDGPMAYAAANLDSKDDSIPVRCIPTPTGYRK
jgi:hypothetical protein